MAAINHRVGRRLGLWRTDLSRRRKDGFMAAAVGEAVVISNQNQIQPPAVMCEDCACAVTMGARPSSKWRRLLDFPSMRSGSAG